MRFVLVAAIWAVLVGGLALYMQQRDRLQPAAAAAEEPVPAPAGAYTLEITPGFTTAGDPFALRGEAGADATVLVRAADRVILSSDRPLAAGVTQTVTPVPGLVAGRNEIYVKAVPPQGRTGDASVLVTLRQGETELFRRTLSGKNGAVVSGTIPFELPNAAEVPDEK